MALNQLPDEIIQHLLYYVPAGDALSNVQLTSRRLKRLTDEPLLWRYYCLFSFKFWNPDHELKRKLRLAPSHVDWKRLFILRTGRNARMAERLEEIITTRVKRLSNIEQICILGYDAKDFLLEQWRNIQETDEDVIARRYYVSAVLDSMHKGVAIKEWRDLRAGYEAMASPRPRERLLERALGAFDLFVLYDQQGDLDDISEILDGMASAFRATQPALNEMTTRQKAVALNRWLRANNYTGLRDPDRDYRNLRNCLIGQALRHEEHESIPIISSGIFCGVAERLGIDAQCCAFPSHVHAVVTAEPGHTLDGAAALGQARQKMYLDPYGFDDEVSEKSLQAILARFGWDGGNDDFLAPVPAVAMVARTARNLEAATVRLTDLRAFENPTPEAGQLMHGNSMANAYACHYASSWAYLMTMEPNTFEWRGRVHILISQFPMALAEDSWLINTYLWPLSGQSSPVPLAPQTGLLHHDPWGSWVEVRRSDENPPPPCRRDPSSSLFIPFHVGQVVKHRRYGWIGIIVGWVDPTTSDLGDRADPGKAFFRCLTKEQARPHLIVDNSIELVNDPNLIDVNEYPAAGQYFKRFDRETCTFVSNMKEEFPDN